VSRPVSSLTSSLLGEAVFIYLQQVALMDAKFRVGQHVAKDGGDYRFVGVVVAVFTKKSGKVRYVVENKDGILHIFSESQLILIECEGSS